MLSLQSAEPPPHLTGLAAAPLPCSPTQGTLSSGGDSSILFHPSRVRGQKEKGEAWQPKTFTFRLGMPLRKPGDLALGGRQTYLGSDPSSVNILPFISAPCSRALRANCYGINCKQCFIPRKGPVLAGVTNRLRDGLSYLRHMLLRKSWSSMHLVCSPAECIPLPSGAPAVS